VRLVLLAESSADEAAIRILTEAIRGPAVRWLEPPTFRSRGWPAVVGQLPTVIRHAHYNSDATAVIAVVDTNDSPLHDAAHSGTPNPDCRLCALRTAAEETLAQLTPIAGRTALRVALGAATPAIEAWYLSGEKPYPSEQTWAAGGARGYDKKGLKRSVYGTDRANLPLMTRVAMAEAARLAAKLELLRTHFPRGYGALEAELLAL